MPRFGNVSESRCTDRQRQSIQISIGTYADGFTAESKTGVLADDPEPNSTTACTGPVKAAISLAALDRIACSVRVG
jgi:hypothetical protein